MKTGSYIDCNWIKSFPANSVKSPCHFLHFIRLTNYEVFNLPPYSPEFNAEERLWHYTRMCTTHNRYFETKGLLREELFATFKQMQDNPKSIEGYLRPFC